MCYAEKKSNPLAALQRKKCARDGFGLSDMPGVRESAKYLLAMNGYVNAFNFGDCKEDIKDVLCLVNVLLNNETVENGDINGDGGISLIDVVLIVKLIV